MIVIFKCASEHCPQEFTEEWPLSSLLGHFLQGRVVQCPTCGLRQLLHPPQPATAIVVSIDPVDPKKPIA